MGPGNSAFNPSPGHVPIVSGSFVVNTPQAARQRAIAKRLSSKSNAIEQGKIKNTPDDKTSFEGI